jgi:hypothetical protein
MPEYLEGSLGQGETKLIEGHLETCADCRQMATLARNLVMLPQEKPSAALRANFQAVLDAYEEGRTERARLSEGRPRLAGWGLLGWLRSPIAGMVLTAALLVVGFVGGRYLNEGNAHSQQELAAMQTELSGMRQLMVLSMLQEESASERLQGVSWSTRQQQADPKILGALLHTLRYDSSVDVRLAALDALSHHGDQAQVRQGLAQELSAQESPLVQVELIDLLVEWHDRSVVDQLHKIEQDSTSDPAVRQRAHWAVGQLS